VADTNTIVIIGRSEIVSFPDITEAVVYARIDTGAKTSSLWASHIKVVGDRLEVIFFGKGHNAYTGKKFYFDEFTHSMVASSNGIAELRYKVKLLVTIEGKYIRASFTLANRHKQAYPVLIGRNILRGKFLVDVTLGKVHEEAETARSQSLQRLRKSRGTN
jgi:hypothetical protein